MTLLLDTHVVYWWSSAPERLSRPATRAITEADELAVAAISWYELARMARREQVTLAVPIRSWLEALAQDVRTVGVSPAIADTAAGLPASFPSDPADRLIFATAVEHGWQLVTKDKGIRAYSHPKPLCVW